MAPKSCCFLQAAVVIFLATPSCEAASAAFLFGDSLIDIGNNEFLPESSNVANVPPYGETYFHKPSGRFSNGLIISDYLARFMGLPFFPPSLKPGANFSQGANFASAGSGILDSTNAESGLMPLNTQIALFQHLVSSWRKERGEEATSRMLSSSIFLLSAGSNDLLGGYLLNSTARGAYTQEQYVRFLITQYNSSIQALYHAGARKIAVTGLGPLGCAPALRLYTRLTQRRSGCYNASNDMALDFNAKLRVLLLQELSTLFPQGTFVCITPYDFFMDMVNNGSKYGFAVTTENCCGGGLYKAGERCGPSSSFLCHKPSKYVFWDFHPTQRAAWLLAKASWNGDVSFVAPLNLKALTSQQMSVYPVKHKGPLFGSTT